LGNGIKTLLAGTDGEKEGHLMLFKRLRLQTNDILSLCAIQIAHQKKNLEKNDVLPLLRSNFETASIHPPTPHPHPHILSNPSSSSSPFKFKCPFLQRRGEENEVKEFEQIIDIMLYFSFANIKKPFRFWQWAGIDVSRGWRRGRNCSSSQINSDERTCDDGISTAELPRAFEEKEQYG
jgi:hypothetical protein